MGKNGNSWESMTHNFDVRKIMPHNVFQCCALHGVALSLDVNIVTHDFDLYKITTQNFDVFTSEENIDLNLYVAIAAQHLRISMDCACFH